MSEFYYQQLSRPEREVYELLLTGFEHMDASIRIPRLENDVLSNVYLRLKLDHPLIFYVVGFTYRFYAEADHVEFLPEYLFDKGKIRMHQQAIESRITRLTRDLKGKSAEEKELSIHQFILENVHYDKLKKSYSHEIIGPLTQGVGVCEGIAKTVKVLCDAVGIPCMIPISEADPERGIKYRHTWNIVTINGQNYHLDATFDNSLQNGTPRFDYYNIDDSRIFRDHQRLVFPVLPCTDGSHFYYRKISLTKTEDIENRVSQALRKKQETMVFHWRGGGLNRQILMELMESGNRAAAKKNKFISCSVNVPQAVIQFYFTDLKVSNIAIEHPDEEEEE